LKQVFVNLLKNSIESILDTGTVTITIEVPDSGNAVEIAVIDDGCGISDDVLPHVFDPFVTTKVTKQNTGLGLSICQHIVENHDGIIECTSDMGTTVTLRLPRV
jgi:signal transduction histidine kinase